MKTRLPLVVVASLILAGLPFLFGALLPTPSTAQASPPITIPLVNSNGQTNSRLWATVCCTNRPGGKVCVTISYPSDKNHNYIVEYCDSLSQTSSGWKQFPGAPHNEGFVSDDVSAAQRFYRIRMLDQSQKGIFALLANDTGLSATDGVTWNPTIDGQVAETGTPTDLQGRLDDTNGTFNTLFPNIPSRSNFVITSNQLNGLAGGILTDGPHGLYLQKYDEVRNILWQNQVSFIYDTTPPDTLITSHPADTNFDSTATFTFTGQDALTPSNQLRFECRIISSNLAPFNLPLTGWFPCSSPQTFSNLLEAWHTFNVRAIDQAGNIDPTPASFSWLIPTPPLSISLALDPRDDSAPTNDFTTTNTLIRLIGQTKPNLTVFLATSGSTNVAWSTTANLAGNFIFSNVPLNLGINLFQATTTNLAGQSATANLTLTNISSAPCVFASLDGWTVTTSGFGLTNLLLTNPVPGSVFASGCEAVITEGDSFLVTLERTFVVPTNTPQPAAIQFTFSGPMFDPTTTNAIKDAFEAAIVDDLGNPLTYVIAGSHDSFFNISDEQPPALAAGVTASLLNPQSSTVSIDVSHLFSGQTFKLIFRLINNDRDHATTARIADVSYGRLNLPIIGQVGPTNLRSIVTQSTNQIDFATLSDVTGSIQGDYGQTSFKDQDRELYADLFVRNVGQYPVRMPLVVGIAHISDPSIQILNADNVTPDGIPYFDFSAALTNGTLNPQQFTLKRTLAFFNPNKVQFTYDLVVLGVLNRAPVITSVPVVDGVVGHLYSYAVHAKDPDGDALTFSLPIGPTNMVINPANGLISWNPAAGDLGSRDIRVRVEDGHGGSTEQRYVLTVTTPPPNRPPYFVTVPVVDAFVNTMYHYTAVAVDPDGDPLTFSLAGGPSGMTLTNTQPPLTGSQLVSWIPSVTQLGTNQVAVQVSDGRGGMATQSYVITVLPDTSNHPPVIISTPVTNAVAGQSYAYDVDALDPDGDPLAYSLMNGPAGMTINTNTGVLSWQASCIPSNRFSLNSVTRDVDQALAMDSAGNVIIGGNFMGTCNLDPCGTNGIVTSQGEADCYVAKYAPSGTLLWAHSIGSSFVSEGTYGVATDKNGYIYLTGIVAAGADFDPGSGVHNSPSGPGQHIFVLKLDPDGKLVWVATVAAASSACCPEGHGIAVDDSGNVYSTGSFVGTVDFDPGPGVFNLDGGGGSGGIYIWKLNSAGQFVWAKGIGINVSGGRGWSVSLDHAGNPYVAGFFAGTADFDPGSGVRQLTADGYDLFLMKLTSSGDFLWAHRLGAPGADERASRVCVGPDDNAYVTGAFSGNLYVDTNSTVPLLTSLNARDVFLAKFTAAGNFVWAQRTGGNLSGWNPYSLGLAVDKGTNIHVCASFEGTAVAGVGTNAVQLTSAGMADIIVSKFDSAGNLCAARSVGGSKADFANAIAVDDSGTEHLVGNVDMTPVSSPNNLIDGKIYLEGFANQFNVPVTVRVDDGRGGYDTQSFDVNVNNNHPPQLATISDKTVLAGTNLQFTIGNAGLRAGELLVGNLSGPKGQIKRINPATGIQEVLYEQIRQSIPNEHLKPNFVPNSVILDNEGNVIVCSPLSGNDFSLSTGVRFNPADGSSTDLELFRVFAQLPNGNYLVQASSNTVLSEFNLVTGHVRTITDQFNIISSGSPHVALAHLPTGEPLIDPSGNVYIGGDYGIYRVNLNSGSMTLMRFGTNQLSFGSPGLAAADTNHLIAVQGEITRLNLATLEMQVIGTAGNPFVEPWGVTVVEDGTIYVADSKASGTSVVSINPQTLISKTISSGQVQGAATGNFFRPIFGVSRFAADGAVDPDGDSLTFSMSGLPPGATFDPATKTFRWTPNLQQGGTYSVTAQVSDGHGGTDARTFLIHVLGAAGAEIHGTVFNDINSNGTRDGNGQFVVNGTFSSGNFGFSSDYMFTNFVYGAAQYAVGDNPAHYHPAAASFGDHTSGQGQMMILNGGDTAGAIVWQETFCIPSFKQFDFSAWVATWYATSPANLRFLFNGVQVGSDFIAPANSGQWANFSTSWNSGTNRFLNIAIADLNTANSGNDFALDDLSLIGHGTGEPGLDGSIVYLDLNHNGRRDAGEPFAETEACGSYSFSSILPGTYSLRVEQIPNWMQSSPTNGEYLLAVTNGAVLSGLDFGEIQVVVIPTNHPPIFVTSPPTNAFAGHPFLYYAAATDPDNDTVRYLLPLAPNGMVVDSTHGIVVWTPTSSQVGPNDVILRVSDGRGGVAIQSFQVLVTAGNHPPQITSVPTGPAIVSIPWQYQVHAQDAENDQITFSLGAHPSTMTINATNGIVVWTPVAADLGTQHAAVVASDGQSTTTQSFDLPVVASATNHSPTITSSPPGSVRLGNIYVYALQASDPDSDPLTFSLTNAPAGMFLTNAQPPSANSRLIVWTPTAAQLGSNSVAVRVDDGRGAAVIQTFKVSVLTSTTNHAPQMTSIPQLAAIIGQQYSYNAQAYDPDNDPLAWSLPTAPTGMSIDPALGTIRWTPTIGQLGTNQVVVQVTDPFGAWAMQTYPITVRTVNLPPQITSTPPTTAATTELYTYPVDATDPENGFLTFSLRTAPTNMVIDPFDGYIEWTPLPSQLGTNNVIVWVTDDAGAFGEQSYSVVVTTNINHYPAITSTPNQYTVVGSNYTYQVTASDEDGDPLTFLLLTKPSGMTINTNSGLVSWTPSLTQTGLQNVAVGVVDSHGAGGSQSFQISVSDGNRPPTITSHPVQIVQAGAAYHYDVLATDADGDALSYSLTGPAGIVIDQLGRVSWSPAIANAGTNRIAITVTDTKGAWVRQDYDLLVLTDTQAPVVHLGHADDRLPVGAILDINAVATDNIGVSSLVVTIGGTPIPLDASGHAEVVLDHVGVFPILARATDAAGNIGQDGFNLTVFQGVVDPNAPVVEITTPTNDAVLTAPNNVIGTASDANLFNYKLEVRPAYGETFTEIARGTNSISNGVLGKLDPSTLANDSYVLRLTATDTGGLSSSVESTFSVAGELKLGNFRLSFTDLSVPVSGVPIMIGRTYDSLNASESGDFGFGWRLEFRAANLRNSLPPRSPEEIDFGFYQGFNSHTRVYVTVPGGKREGFTFQPVRVPGFAGTYFGLHKPAFVADAGVTSQLTVPAGSSIVLQQDVDGNWNALDGVGGTTAYNPDDPALAGTYTLTTKEGLAYQIDAATRQVTQVIDANGNTLTFSDAAVIHSSGQRVNIGRDPQSRIISITDPMGKVVRYAYNVSGDLISVTDRQTNVTQFVYSPTRPHFLQQVIDPLGRFGVRTDYDDQGRLKTLTDAAGNLVQMLHDAGNSTEQVVDALGHTNTFIYDERGNVTLDVNALGAVTRRSYDLNNFMTMEVDALGNTNLFTYDGDGNVVTRTDPLGNVTRNTYLSIPPHGWTSFGARTLTLLQTSTDPLGNSTVNNYDGGGNLTSTTDAAGNVTRYTYDGAGNQTSLIDAHGKTNRFAYDGAGRLLNQTDALGNVTSFSYDGNGNQLSQTSVVTVKPGDVRTLVTSTTYDSNGRPTSATDAAGNTSRTEYDALGNTKATIDALGHRTTFFYNERGQLTNTAFADGTSSSLTYDAAGRRTTSTDRAGRITRFEYDALGRLTNTIYADLTHSQTLYDLAGRVVAQIDERANRTAFAYDSAGRQTAVTNALNVVTRSEFDNAGRKISDIDGLGHTTRFVYDEVGRRTQTLLADSTTKRTLYDALGRVAAEVDQAGVTNAFGYDAVGRLTSVTNALGTANQTVTVYGYNESGNLVRQQDANGHVTRYEYETCCQRSATILPLGQRSTTIFNAANNVAVVTNFNGQAINYDYDVNNRLAVKTLPGGVFVRYGYTPTGRRATITNSTGVTIWTYDARDRLLSRTDPDGRGIEYGYDQAGNRTRITTLANYASRLTNQVWSFTFDALNRLETVADSGGTNRYTYDPANNLAIVRLANGTSRTNFYDALNRVTNIFHAAPSGVFSSFRYTLGPTGNRRSVQELGGRTVSWDYDALNRLTRETVTADPAGQNYTGDYVYDSVGNRLYFTNSLEGVTRYGYDDNDQLLTENRTGGSPLFTAYAYDFNGNTLSRSNVNEFTTYAWSADNHLTNAQIKNLITSAATNLQYIYDDDGIRVGAVINDGSNANATSYLVDANRPFAEVLEEWNSLYSQPSTLNVSYTYGHQLLSQNRAGIRSYYHADHLGSTRALTGQTGSPTDRYAFDAYGRLLTPNSQLPTPNSYLFAGEQRDNQLGLDYLRARYLDFSAGRFYGPDLFAGQRMKPQTQTRFVYAIDEPISIRDPNGTFSLSEAMATVAIIGVLSVIPGSVHAPDFNGPLAITVYLPINRDELGRMEVSAAGGRFHFGCDARGRGSNKFVSDKDHRHWWLENADTPTGNYSGTWQPREDTASYGHYGWILLKPTTSGDHAWQAYRTWHRKDIATRCA